jgi:hypothetical protein
MSPVSNRQKVVPLDMLQLSHQVLAIKKYLLFFLVSTDFKEVPMRLMPNPFKICRLYNLQQVTTNG